MRIRPMTLDDYTSARALWVATPGMGLNSRDDSPEGIALYLRRNPTTCFVAERDGGPDKMILTGVILAGHDGRRGWIYHTAVAVAERGRGVGTALLEKAMQALEAEGIAKVALVAFTDNKGGNTFWEKQGFRMRTDLVYRNKTIKGARRLDRLETL